MQVFIIGSPLETATTLDKKRLNKQIIECKQILDALDGKAKAWRNHPCVLQYQAHILWLCNYMRCLSCYQSGDLLSAQIYSLANDNIRPPFHTQEYFDQMKRRLYTKDPVYYQLWEYLGESDVNWYFVDGEWRHYRDGKRIRV